MPIIGVLHAAGDRLGVARLGVMLAAAASALAAPQVVVAQSPPPSPPRPNVIHILADDLGWGSVGFNLAPTDPRFVKTPNVDRLAADGLRMTAGYCPSALCAPTRAALLTGMHNGHTYVDRNGVGITNGFRAEDVTVAEVLRSAGYSTGIVGKWGFGGSDPGVAEAVSQPNSLPNNQGYDYFYGYLNHRRAHNYFEPNLWETQSGAANGVTTVATGGAYTHDLFEQRALQFLADRAGGSQPFYLQFNPTIPHSDLDDIAQVPDWDSEYRNEPDSVYGPADSQRRKYAAMVTRMDASVGRLLAKLDDPNGDGNTADSVAVNTLIVFTSDNGPSTEDGAPYNLFNLNGPNRGGKRDLYEGGVRVPMALRWADHVAAGSVTDRVIDQADFLPTIAELAGAESPVGMDGVSFAPLLSGDGLLRDRPHFVFEHHESVGPAGGSAARWAIRRENYKLIRFADGTSGLYDLAADPGETTNLAASNAAMVASLEAAALAEGVAEAYGHAAEYRTWTATANDARVADESNWTGADAPGAAWSAVVENITASDKSAIVDQDVQFLGFGVRGGPTVTQTVIVSDGVTLSGRNEIRVSRNGRLELQGGRLVTQRWVDVRAGGTLSGNGEVTGDVYNAGRIVASGGVATFRGGVRNAPASEFRVEAGATASFDGIVTGAEAFTGPGAKVFTAGVAASGAFLATTGTTHVDAGASLTIGHVREASLTVNGLVTVTPDGTAAGTSVLGALSIDGGTLALNDNDVIVDYTGASPETQIREWVFEGLVSGSGITTLPASGDDTVLAVAEQSEWAEASFNGFELDDTTVVGKYTYFGDANLDGQVTTDDYVAVDLGLGTGDSWVQGDFDLNGVVTTDDYVVVDLNLGKGTAAPAAWAQTQAEMIALHSEMFGHSYVEKLAYASEHGWVAASIPEPSAAALVAAVAVGLALRRRRRGQTT